MSEEPFWQSSDGRTKIIRTCDAVFSLEHDGIEVMFGRFEPLNAYMWAEFMIEPEFSK